MLTNEIDKKVIPDATPIDKIKVDADEFVIYIVADTERYLRKFRSKAVKKTLTISEWLNDEAVNAGINFSQTLQTALRTSWNADKDIFEQKRAGERAC